MHFRHPYELGGLYFSLNMFLPLLGLTVVLASDLVKDNLSESTVELLTSLVTVLGGSLTVLLGAFLLLMNKEYRHTFFSFDSGHKLTRRLFLEGDDVSKAQVFGSHEFQWTPIRDKVKAWVKEGWATWEEEKPEWFTDMWKASVPEDMIPMKVYGEEASGEVVDSDRVKINEPTKANGRRKSLLEGLLDGRRLSVYKDAKISPVQTEGANFDQEDFLRQMKRRGSIM
ncbi:hypothetical protein TrST_g2648 [Triparma strigata]|nr:hypothetical protein TrST_g2648 [Triparma strigata]